MKPALIITADGSHSIFLEELKEHYHSINGAITESEQVYLKNGFLLSEKQEINVLEIGFGTGLNCLLTAMKAEELSRKVTYIGIENNPIKEDTHILLNYPLMIGKNSKSVFDKIFYSPWEKLNNVNPYFILGKYRLDIITQMLPEKMNFDVVYFDAFAPGIQPDLWSADVFRKIFNATSEGGIITTFCSKGVVRRNLAEIGFEMERLQGPPGKREVLRGIKKTGKTYFLKK